MANQQTLISQLIVKHKLPVSTLRYPIRMLDYIGFTFEDFDRECVVIVDKLHKLCNEENLPVHCLRYLQTHKYLNFNAQHTG